MERNINHNNLQLIVTMGFKTSNERAVKFSKRPSQIVKDNTIQGWTMDVDRLKKTTCLPTNISIGSWPTFGNPVCPAKILSKK